MNETILRVIDALLALLWAWVLFHTLRSGHLGPVHRGIPARRSSPGLYWFMALIFALMVVHFAGLAAVGQPL